MNSGKEAGLFFLDSGAHSLYTAQVIKLKGYGTLQRKRAAGYAYYDTPEFWGYVDEYAAFVKRHRKYIDYYATVDVIFDPARSWKVLKYLEQEHGLSPVPVIHFGTSLKWIERHLEAGYEFLGLGGLGQEATANDYLAWADRVFHLLCPPPTRLPIVRTHGFAMTAYKLMLRYPWWSVDSATWTKVGAFGGIMVPQQRRGVFTFETQPWLVAVSEDSPQTKDLDKHYGTMKAREKTIVREWLDQIDVPFGTSKGGKVVHGVSNRHSERKIANLLFFEALRAWLPAYPRPFNPPRPKGVQSERPALGLFE